MSELPPPPPPPSTNTTTATTTITTTTSNVHASVEKLGKAKDKDAMGGSKEVLASSSTSADASKRQPLNTSTTNTTTNTNTNTNTNAAMMTTMMNANIEKAAEVGQRIYENSYRMVPEKKFPTELAKKLTQDILTQYLSKTTYASEKASDLSKVIAKDIIQAMKGLNLERYKFVADVTIGEFRGQGIRSSSRALWDQTTDSFTSATFKNSSLFCVAIVFGVFFE